MRIALFSLEHTVLRGNLDALWCGFLAADALVDADHAVQIARMQANPLTGAKDWAAMGLTVLTGHSAGHWLRLRERFLRGHVLPRIETGVRDLMRKQREFGDTVVLMSSSNRLVAEPVAQSLQVHDLICTEVQDAQGVLTGLPNGQLNVGITKVAHLRLWMQTQRRASPVQAEYALADSVFFGSSIEDLPLFDTLGKRLVLQPDSSLAKLAVQRGWSVWQAEAI